MRIVFVVLLAIGLSGCNSVGEYVQQIYSASVAVNTAVKEGRDAIKVYCSGIGSAYNEAGALAVAQASGQCKAIARTQAVIDANRAVCLNVDTLTAVQLYTYGKKLVTQWKTAKDAVVKGC